MLDLIVDPKLYFLFAAVYVVGFVGDEDDSAARHDVWGKLAQACFWGSMLSALLIFAAHGLFGGLLGLLGAWAVAIAGQRRGMIAQQHRLWETPLWSMPLGAILAARATAPQVAAVPTSQADRPRREVRTPRTPAFRLPTLEELMPRRRNRLTMLGIAVDFAVCLMATSALSFLVH